MIGLFNVIIISMAKTRPIINQMTRPNPGGPSDAQPNHGALGSGQRQRHLFGQLHWKIACLSCP